jgi:hypothetical protein
MRSNRARSKLMFTLGAAILLGAFLLLVLSPVEGLVLNAGGRAYAVGLLPTSTTTPSNCDKAWEHKSAGKQGGF